jgi:hypothetical protein
MAVGLLYLGLAVVVMLAASAARHRHTMGRDERGAADSSFMKGVVKVSLIVMLVAGGIVWIVDRAADNGSDDRTPHQRHPDVNRQGH